MDAAPSPDSTEVRETLYTVGHWLWGNAQYDNALRVFRALVLAAPADERAWLGLGACKERLGDDGAALKLYAMGAMAVPSSGRCCLAAARLLREQGNDDAADEALARAERLAEDARDDSLVDEVTRFRRTA